MTHPTGTVDGGRGGIGKRDRHRISKWGEFNDSEIGFGRKEWQSLKSIPSLQPLNPIKTHARVSLERTPLIMQATMYQPPRLPFLAVLLVGSAILSGFLGPALYGQRLAKLESDEDFREIENPPATVLMKEEELIEGVINPELILRVEPTRSKIVRTRLPVSRVAITNSDVIDVNEFGPKELEIIGLHPGETTLTLWFQLPNGQITVLRYVVQVSRNEAAQRLKEDQIARWQDRINEVFPNSQVQLFSVENKIIVRGQARDAKEATDIMQMLGQNTRGGGYGRNGNNQGTGGGNGNYITAPVAGSDRSNGGFSGSYGNRGGGFNGGGGGNGGVSLINLLRVPGVHQVMLKVRVAELTRNAAREIGGNLSGILGNLSLGNAIGGSTGDLSAILNDGDLQLLLRAFATHGYGKILAEPTLVTISGHPAEFLAGGQFAVPTAVGIGGIGAASTGFRGFGTQLSFTPTVIDKDMIRLEVNPSFSTLNTDATVNGIPGLNQRSVETTVDLREGQWLAIAGLIQDEQGGQRTYVPILGRLPMLGGLFSRQNTSRAETELIVLVSPELVHPMEPEEVPLNLPGMEVTDPTNADFFCRNLVEGYEGFDYRSTVWPTVQGQEMGQAQGGPVAGHGAVVGRLQGCRCGGRGCHSCRAPAVVDDAQQYYISGPVGLSE